MASFLVFVSFVSHTRDFVRKIPPLVAGSAFFSLLDFLLLKHVSERRYEKEMRYNEKKNIYASSR